MNDYSKAIRSLNKSLLYSKKYNIQDYLPLTFINMSAVYSELDKHKISLKYALQAVKILKQIWNIDDDDYEDDITENIEYATDKENYSLLAVANYNVGVQHEFLKEYLLAKDAFQTGISKFKIQKYNMFYIDLLKKYTTISNPLIDEFQMSLNKLTNKIRRNKSKQNRTFTNLNMAVIQKRFEDISLTKNPNSRYSKGENLFTKRLSSAKIGKNKLLYWKTNIIGNQNKMNPSIFNSSDLDPVILL